MIRDELLCPLCTSIPVSDRFPVIVEFSGLDGLVEWFSTIRPVSRGRVRTFELSRTSTALDWGGAAEKAVIDTQSCSRWSPMRPPIRSG